MTTPATIGRARGAAALALIGTLLSASEVPAQQALNGFLKDLAAVRQQGTAARATVTAQIHNLEGDHEERWTIAVRPGAAGEAVFVDLEKSKVRALALSPQELHVAGGGKAKSSPPDTVLDATSWTVEDLLPFSPERCSAMRIADLQPGNITVICEPQRARSQYSLMVWKFDRQKLVPSQVLLYKETLNNLVKVLRFDDYAAVGKGLRPKSIVMQDYKLRTKDDLQCEWSETAAPADLFDAAKFAGAAMPGTTAAR